MHRSMPVWLLADLLRLSVTCVFDCSPELSGGRLTTADFGEHSTYMHNAT